MKQSDVGKKSHSKGRAAFGRDSSSGEKAAALAPPAYGVDFIDRQHRARGGRTVDLAPPAYGIDFIDRQGRGTQAEQPPGSLDPAQRQPRPDEEARRLLQRKAGAALAAPPQAGPPSSPNRTGMPDRLKAGIEALSAMDLSDVRVHVNSDKPAQLDALAYAQGNEIHLAPGQERHLPHEAWHVVQQRQGRVQATMQAKGRAINDDPQLEREADIMGAKAMDAGHAAPLSWGRRDPAVTQAPVQRLCSQCEEQTSRQPVQRQPSDVIQRLTITNSGGGVKGNCGQYQVRWRFRLDNPAPADGYIVQQIDFHEDIKGCDQARVNATPIKPSLTFWEAWPVNKGDRDFSSFGLFGFSDQSSAAARNNTSGVIAARGAVKFFSKATTGDLGDLGQAPAVAVGGWGPGAQPQSGILPSTNNLPAWWGGAAVEGPAYRWASSWWNCCGEQGTRFSTIDWNP